MTLERQAINVTISQLITDTCNFFKTYLVSEYLTKQELVLIIETLKVFDCKFKNFYFNIFDYIIMCCTQKEIAILPYNYESFMKDR